MKLRIAKKVMNYNPNRKFNWHFNNHLRKLRPSYINESGHLVLPSCHDVHIIREAHHRLFQWIRRVRDRYEGKFATISISNGEQKSVLTARIVKWNKKYVWLNNNPAENGIRVPWSDVIKVE